MHGGGNLSKYPQILRTSYVNGPLVDVGCPLLLLLIVFTLALRAPARSACTYLQGDPGGVRQTFVDAELRVPHIGIVGVFRSQ